MKHDEFGEDHLEEIREQLTQKLQIASTALHSRSLSSAATEALDDLAFVISVVADEDEAVQLVRQFTKALLTEEIGPWAKGVRRHDQ
ncbi:MAG: hypothetical protein AAFR65_03210 [Pseudomonadota bacterium]